MAYQEVEDRLRGKGSLHEFNIVAKRLFLHFVMHRPWDFVFLEPDFRKHKLSR